MEKKDMICIVCPIGCKMEVTENKSSDEGYDVSGNQCLRGKVYGVKEMTNPTRVLTTTVKIEDGSLSRLPVTTKGAIPKGLMMEAMKEINKVTVSAPIKVGEIIIKNLLDTGIDVAATRSMEAVQRFQNRKVS